MSLMTPSPADAQRRVGLRRMRLLALSLLVLAAIVYAATLGVRDATGWGYVNTAAEAAMVGALADWFAVTALFKHPLGLPIPHTAIIPKRKNEIGRNLQEFVTENFLTEEIARERLAAAHVGERLGHWLAEPANRHRAMVEMRRAGRAGLERMNDAEVRSFVEDMLIPRLAREPISPIAGSLLEGVVADGSHRGVVDLGVDQLRTWLVDNPGTFHQLMGERAPWWSPPFLDERVISWTYTQVTTWLQEIHDNQEHPARLALDDLLRRLAHDLQNDADTMARAEQLKTRLLTHPQAGATALALWQSLKSSLLTAMDDESSYLWVRGDELIADFSQHLLEDEAWRTRLEGNLGDAVAFFINTYGSELAEVISATIDRWDGKEASDRIELHVGRDLQFNRINGTIVGALAGVVIHALSQLFGG
jgi:uncharacterized membrane-anchored protein YjiN (DUF445 family)